MTWTPPPQDTLAPQTGTPRAPEPSLGRLVGVDLARALAVFGMFVVHLGPTVTAWDGVGGWVRGLAEGHSAVLFATLAGFSLMLIAGRREPKTGVAGRRAKARIAIRALVLLALGTVMAMVYGGVVILAFYGVYFLLALPLVRLRARTLAIVAAVLAVAMPQVAFGLRILLTPSVEAAVTAHDPLALLGGVGVLELLLTGFYPVLTWMPFVIAGMALARLDLTARPVLRRLAVAGPALIVLGYGTSWLASTLVPAVRDVVQAGAGDSAGSAWSLLTAGPHTGTTFDIIGSLGVAITVLLCATVAMDRLPRLRRLAGPVIAVGTMSLTAYVGHFVVSSLVSLEMGAEKSADAAAPASWVPVLLFVLGAILFAAIWSRFFRRGPLEYLLNAATKPAGYLR